MVFEKTVNAKHLLRAHQSVAAWGEECKKDLNKVLCDFKFNFQGGELKITHIDELNGSAIFFKSNRKKIISYDYSAMLRMECSLFNTEGKV